jgi:hypothetical protein
MAARLTQEAPVVQAWQTAMAETGSAVPSMAEAQGDA